MLLLVTQGMPQMRQHAHPSLGRLLTPRHYPNLEEMHGLRWAADNDCFQGLHERRWRTMLESIEHASGRCLFVVVPDKVADAEATAAMFERYHDGAPPRPSPRARGPGEAAAQVGAHGARQQRAAHPLRRVDRL